MQRRDQRNVVDWIDGAANENIALVVVVIDR
jgi:hypothetical protein